MRLFHTHAGQLVVREGPTGLRLAALVLGGGGAFFAWAGLTGWQIPPEQNAVRWGIGLIGLLAVGGAPKVWRQAPNRRVTLDAARRVVVVEQRGLPESARFREVAWSEVVRIEVERGSDDDGHPTFRVLLRLADGSVLPLRTQANGDEGAVRKMAAATAALSGWATQG